MLVVAAGRSQSFEHAGSNRQTGKVTPHHVDHIFDLSSDLLSPSHFVIVSAAPSSRRRRRSARVGVMA